jgi:hypothetical protein
MSDTPVLTGTVAPDVIVDIVGETIEVLVYAPQGPQGEPGPIGPQGPPGISGAQGLQGIQGPQGVPGTPGATGPEGPEGPQGIQGIQGSAGEQGEPGPEGAAGAPGPPGADGAMGPIGPAAFEPHGAWDSSTAYVEGDVVQFGGSSWYAIDSSTNQQPPATPNTANAYWGYLALVGAQGPQGPPGEKGDTGETGPQGEQGPAGEQGIQGEQGEQGPPGVEGEQGEPGPEGPQGAPGEIADIAQVADGEIPAKKLEETAQNALALAQTAQQNPTDIEPRLRRLMNSLASRFVGIRDSRLWDDRHPTKRSVDFGELALGVEGHNRFTPVNLAQSLQERDQITELRSYVDRVQIDVLEREGWAPRDRIETISVYDAHSDLVLANGDLMVWEVDPLQQIALSRFLVAVGGTASVGASRIRGGIYSIVSNVYTLIAASEDTATARLASPDDVESWPFRVSGSLPRSYTPDPYARWALSVIAVGQSTPGTLRGVNLGASQTFTKVAQVLPGQTDLLSTFNASQLQRSGKLAYVAGAGQ